MSLHLSELGGSGRFTPQRNRYGRNINNSQDLKSSKIDTLTDSINKSIMKLSVNNDLLDSEIFDSNNKVDEVIDEIQYLNGKVHAYSKNSGVSVDKKVKMMPKSPKMESNQMSPSRNLRESYMFPKTEREIPGQYEFFRTTPPRKLPK